ncbi:MAG TPA: class I SAM-dependent methyltransferase [Pseudomonadales bacterium]
MKATVVLEAGREKSLLRRHPWVFASAIRNHGGKLHSGDTVDIHAADGRWLARGAYSPASTIRVRAWTFDKAEVIDNAFFVRRIESAWRARQLLRLDGNAYRLVAAESDGLPGVTVDRYADVLVCQLLSAGAERHRDKIVWALRKLFPDCAILERSDVQIREKEGLPLLTQTLHGDVPSTVTIVEAGHQFDVDLMHGHKTGFYLDQRTNRARIAAYAQGRSVLNCFSYTGSIAVYCLGAGAAHVTNLDSSEAMLAQAAQHIAMNGLDADNAAHVTTDVFAELRKYRAEGRRFDLIVLDPPKFVESKQHLTQACRGYKDINLLALQLLNPDGILATFSCSGLMPEELFHKVVADAALDAGRTVQYLEKLAQDRDHPVAAAYPEGFYLKGLICRVE